MVGLFDIDFDCTARGYRAGLAGGDGGEGERYRLHGAILRPGGHQHPDEEA